MQLHWSKCFGDSWCRLDQVDPRSADFFGVFIIWRNGERDQRASAVLYIGHGLLREQISRCQRDPLFAGSAGLYITWAGISDVEKIEPIAAYLYQHLRPVWGEVLAPLNVLPVNLPLRA